MWKRSQWDGRCEQRQFFRCSLDAELVGNLFTSFDSNNLAKFIFIKHRGIECIKCNRKKICWNNNFVRNFSHALASPAHGHFSMKQARRQFIMSNSILNCSTQFARHKNIWIFNSDAIIMNFWNLFAQNRQVNFTDWLNRTPPMSDQSNY